MLPRRQQLALGVEGPVAVDGEAPVNEGGLGDLGDARRRVVLQGLPARFVDLLNGGADVRLNRTPIENSQPALSRRAKVFLAQNPESARSSFGPVAPARSTRAISSSQEAPDRRAGAAEARRPRPDGGVDL